MSDGDLTQDYSDAPVFPCFKSRPRRVLEEDPLAAVPMLGDVMRGAEADDAGDAGHEASVAGRG
jgi:hypothetical protein